MVAEVIVVVIVEVADSSTIVLYTVYIGNCSTVEYVWCSNSNSIGYISSSIVVLGYIVV